MGILKWFPYVQEEADVFIREKKYEDYKRQKWCIDTSIFIYKFSMGGNDPLIGFWKMIKLLEKYEIEPYFVFDGARPTVKKITTEERAMKRANDKKMIETLKIQKLKMDSIIGDISPFEQVSAEDVKKIEMETDSKFETIDSRLQMKEKNLIEIKKEDIIRVKQFLKECGVMVVDAVDEGEATCCFLNRMGLCDAIVTEDSDVFLFGGVTLIRQVNYMETPLKEYKIQEILEFLELSHNNMIDIALLSKSDYSEGIKGIGPTIAIDLVRKHYSIRNVLRHLKKETFKSGKKKGQNKWSIPENFDWKTPKKFYQEHLEMVMNPIMERTIVEKSDQWEKDMIEKWKLTFYEFDNTEW